MESRSKGRFSRGRFRNLQGFTLIEVLVVVAIIALLVSILIPVLSRARDQAYRASCASQLHQIGLGLMAYGQDHRQLLPYRGWKSYTIAESRWEALGGTPRDEKVLCNLGLLVGGKNPHISAPGTLAKHRSYLAKNWDMVYCPASLSETRDRPRRGIGGGLDTRWDEAAIYTFGGYDYAVPLQGRGHCPKLGGKSIYANSDLENKWKGVLLDKLGPGRTVRQGLDAVVSDWAVGGPGFIHQNGINVLYSDWHVRYLKVADAGASSHSMSAMELWWYVTTNP